MFGGIIAIIMAFINTGLLYLIRGITKSASLGSISDIINNWIPIDPDSGKYSALFSNVKTISDLLTVVGCGLVVAFFFYELINMLAKDQLSSHTLLKAGIQLIFSFGIVMYAYDLCLAIVGVGSWFVNNLNFSISNTNSEPEVKSFLIGNSLLEIFGFSIPSNSQLDSDGFISIADSLAGTNFEDAVDVNFDGNIFEDILNMIMTIGKVIIEILKKLVDPKGAKLAIGNNALLVMCIIGVILAIIYYLAMQIIHLILILQCVSRAVQVAIYAAMAPIGIASWFGGSIMTSSAMKYVKKMIALSIQGGLMVLILQLSLSLSFGTDDLFLTFIGPLTAVGLFSKSNQIANDVCGT